MDLPPSSVLPPCPAECPACLSCTPCTSMKVFVFPPRYSLQSHPSSPGISKQPSASAHTSHHPKRPLSCCSTFRVSRAIVCHLLTAVLDPAWLRAPPLGSIQEAGTLLLPSHPAPMCQYLLLHPSQSAWSEEGNRTNLSCLSQAFFPALKYFLWLFCTSSNSFPPTLTSWLGGRQVFLHHWSMAQKHLNLPMKT